MSTYADILRKGISASQTSINDDVLFARRMAKQKTKQQPNVLHYVDGGINLTHRSICHKIPKLIQDALTVKCRTYVAIAGSVNDSKKALALVREFNRTMNTKNAKMYCTVGVQPHDAERALTNSDWTKELEDLIVNNKDVVVAIGKCGLDYDRMFSPKEAQREVFQKQIELAKRHGLPLFLHERDAQNDFLQCLDGIDGTEEKKMESERGMIHCFTGNNEDAEKYLTRGFYLGITGRICDDAQNAELTEALRQVVPADKIVIETDAPYMTPKDLKRRPYYNGPQFIPHISARVASIKGIRRDDFCRQVLSNFRRLYRLDDRLA